MALFLGNIAALGTAAYMMGQQAKKGNPRMAIEVHFFVNHSSKVEILLKTPKSELIINNGNGGSYPAVSEAGKAPIQLPNHWGVIQVPMLGGLSDISSPHKEFSFTVSVDGRVITRKFQDINIFTGTFGTGNMTTTDQQKAIFDSGTAISYTFYEAQKTEVTSTSLPSSHQLDITIAPERSNWMKIQLNRNPDFYKTILNRFALPSPHNFGMYDLTNVKKIYNGTNTFKDIAKERAHSEAKGKSFLHVPTPTEIMLGIEVGLGKDRARWAVKSTTFNQKDDVTSQLRLGARHFEVRASRPRRDWLTRYPELEDDYYFYHADFPGIKIRSFIHDVVNFLALPDSDKEFVVIYWTWSNWTAEQGVTEAQVQEALKMITTELDRIKTEKGLTLAIGTLSDTRNMSIQDLLNSNKRIILTWDSSPNETKWEVSLPYDIYDSDHHKTFSGKEIVAEMMSMSTAGQTSKIPNTTRFPSWTRLQAQATVTEDTGVRAAVVTADSSNYFLLSEKGNTDCMTLPWIWINANDRLKTRDQFLVVMNDFFDLGTSDVANYLSIYRFNDDHAPLLSS